MIQSVKKKLKKKNKTVLKKALTKLSRGFIFVDRRIRQISLRQILAGLPKNWKICEN